MPRPKSILWVDDEIDGLAAHRRFLETQGFTVASAAHGDRKSTRLNSSHSQISYAVFCLNKNERASSGARGGWPERSTFATAGDRAGAARCGICVSNCSDRSFAGVCLVGVSRSTTDAFGS